MKIILSRKGFDSKAGGVPNPILSDGTLLSFPIPAKNDNISYTDLFYDGVAYSDILAQLKPKDSKIGNWNCHLDPDIQENIKQIPDRHWTAAFGQCDASQSYLANKQVGIGDLFLFFGWFKQTEGDLHNGTLRYIKNAPDLHVLYGYLQVGEIVTDKTILQENYSWHPHASQHFTCKQSNALYLPTKFLTIEKTKKGYGTFTFSENKILTLSGGTRATWKEIEALQPENINKNVKNSAKNKGIYYAGQWQELILKENSLSEEWAKSLF